MNDPVAPNVVSYAWPRVEVEKFGTFENDYEELHLLGFIGLAISVMSSWPPTARRRVLAYLDACFPEEPDADRR